MRPSPRPFLIFVVLTVLGAGLAYLAFNMEQETMNSALSGREETASGWHQLRPWALALVPLLPALGSFFYLLGDTLDRYLSRAFIRCFGGTLLTLIAIWLLADLNDNLSDFKRSEDGWSVAGVYYLSQLPSMLVLIMPYSLLISLLYLLGGFSKSNEIVSILQCGRSLPRLAAPLVVGGVLASLACLVFNFHWAPQADRYRDGILNQARIGADGRPGMPNVIYQNETDARIWRVEFLSSTYAEGTPLEGLTIEEYAEPGVLTRVTTAETAKWNPKNGQWTLYSGQLMDYTSETPKLSALPATYQTDEFLETPWQFLNPTLQPEQRGIPSLSERLATADLSESETQRLQTQRYLRIANALTCLIVVAIAIPLGVVFTRRGTATGVATAVFIAAAMLFSGQVIPSFGEAGYLPPFLAAFGTNLFFGILAYLLINRRIKGHPIYAQLRSLIGLRT